jgi:proteasome assembly chaperone (PAC2) family protein
MRFTVKWSPPPVRRLIAGLPDMGNVAGIAMQHFLSSLHLESFATCIDSWPPFVAHKGGRIEFERGGFSLHFRDGLDFVAMTGTHQPSGTKELYELCEAALDIAQTLGVREVYTLGAAHYGDDYVETPRVFYASTSQGLEEKLRNAGSVPLETEGYITGFNGLLLGLAMERDMAGACLLGEIGDPHVRQPMAAKAVLEVLSQILGVTLDYSALDEEIEQIRATRAIERALRRGGTPGVM